MSFNDDILFEKFTNMEPDKASELVLSILLTSNPPERREKAVQKLIEINDNHHFQEIKSAYLNETHSNVKLSFIKLISKFYGEEGIEFLKMQYKNEKDWKIRKEIVISVGDRTQDENLDFFLDALKDSNIRIKKKSIQYLGQIRDSKAFDGLMDLLKYGNTEYHRDLIKSIVNIIRNSEEQLISKYIEDSNIHIQRAIPLILRRIENDESIGYLVDLLNQNDSIIKENCLRALRKFKNSDDPNTVKAIIEELNNKSSKVKQEAIKALGRIGNKAATVHLLKELKDKDDDQEICYRCIKKPYERYEFYQKIAEFIS
ncbi:MAG: HEAT repeat domain-containing protein [Promethearchaeati archaeon]